MLTILVMKNLSYIIKNNLSYDNELSIPNSQIKQKIFPLFPFLILNINKMK